MQVWRKNWKLVVKCSCRRGNCKTGRFTSLIGRERPWYAWKSHVQSVRNYCCDSCCKRGYFTFDGTERSAPTKHARLLFFVVKYSNLWRPCRRLRHGCLSCQMAGRGEATTGRAPSSPFSLFNRNCLLFAWILVSFAAVFRFVTQRSSLQTAAFFRTTFLSLCLSVQAIDQSYRNHCLNSNQSKCNGLTTTTMCPELDRSVSKTVGNAWYISDFP